MQDRTALAVELVQRSRSRIDAARHVPATAQHKRLEWCATTSSWRRLPCQSASVRCTNLVLRHAHTSRAFDNGEPYLKSNRLRKQAFKLIYKNGAADQTLHFIFMSRGGTHSVPRT
jgi:hypothetical protein